MPVARRTILRIKMIFAIASAVLFVLTLFTDEWIEIATGTDPDGGSGMLEWMIVAGFALLALVCGYLAHSEWRRQRAAAVSGA